jgi:hypothetical protein
MMSRWCDQSIPDERHSAFSSGPLEVAVLFGTLVAETVLASVHVRAHKQAGHMDTSDLIKTLQNTLQGGGRPHMENHCGRWDEILSKIGASFIGQWRCIDSLQFAQCPESAPVSLPILSLPSHTKVGDPKNLSSGLVLGKLSIYASQAA